MNTMVFFICFALKKVDISLGMALGLFAIFAIIRYRTDAIRVKEMTYLFIVIGLAVINSLTNKKMSYAELFLANGFIFFATFMLEHLLFAAREKLATQNLIYNNLELLKPQNLRELIVDIEKQTGITAQRVDIKKIDLKAKTGTLVVYYVSPKDDEL